MINIFFNDIKLTVEIKDDGIAVTLVQKKDTSPMIRDLDGDEPFKPARRGRKPKKEAEA